MVENITDPEEYLVIMRAKATADEQTPAFYKSAKEAEILCGLGKHTEALPLFEAALNGLKGHLEDDKWENVYLSTVSQYAAALDTLGDLVSAEQMYTHVLELDPSNFCVGDFAIFLHRRKRDYNNAERYYKQALKLFPKMASMHFKYAGFLRHVRQNVEEAEKHYKLSVECNPRYADGVGGYASFLHGTGGDRALAESLYEQSLQLDRTHVNNMCNYGLFLSEELKNFTRAEEVYKQALEMFPRHANTLYNYAVMLDSHCFRKDEADKLYRRCIEVEPRHSFALYNLAVLREECLNALKKTETDIDGAAPSAEWDSGAREVRSLYERALEADPRDSTTMADCGRFIADKLRDPEAGEPLLRGALQMDPECDVAALHLGIIELRFKHNYAIASSLFRSIIRRNPKHAAALHQLARTLVEQHKSGDSAAVEKTPAPPAGGSKPASPRRGTALIAAASAAMAETQTLTLLEEALGLFESAAESVKEPGSILYEYVEVAYHHGTPKQKLRAIVFVEASLNDHRGSPYISSIMTILSKLKT